MSSLNEFLAPVFDNKTFIRFNLCPIAAKLLIKFIEQKDKYLSLSAARKNYAHISSHDCFIIAGELEKMGYLLGKFDKGRLVYKFNDSQERTSVSIPLTNLEEAQKRFNERIAKKVERAAKTIERYKNLGEIVSIVESEERKEAKDLEIEKQALNGNLKEIEYVPKSISTKTALELHMANTKECDSSVCRFCALEQDKEIGF